MRLNQKVTQTVTFLKNLINQNQFKKISHTQPPKKQSIMIKKKNKIYLNVEQTLISTRNLKQQKKQSQQQRQPKPPNHHQSTHIVVLTNHPSHS